MSLTTTECVPFGSSQATALKGVRAVNVAIVIDIHTIVCDFFLGIPSYG